MTNQWGGIRPYNLNTKHHSPVLVNKYVTMQDIQARIIHEAASHLEISGDSYWLLSTKIHSSRGNGKHVSPNMLR